LPLLAMSSPPLSRRNRRHWLQRSISCQKKTDDSYGYTGCSIAHVKFHLN